MSSTAAEMRKTPRTWERGSPPVFNVIFSIEMGRVFCWKTKQKLLLCRIFSTPCQNVADSWKFCTYKGNHPPVPSQKSSCIPGTGRNHTVLLCLSSVLLGSATLKLRRFSCEQCPWKAFPGIWFFHPDESVFLQFLSSSNLRWDSCYTE